MKKSFFNSLLQLKPRQQTNQTEENLLANQKVGKKEIWSTLHVGHTYVNVTLIVPDGSLGFQQQDQKQVDVFGSGNNIAGTININGSI